MCLIDLEQEMLVNKAGQRKNKDLIQMKTHMYQYKRNTNLDKDRKIYIQTESKRQSERGIQ